MNDVITRIRENAQREYAKEMQKRPHRFTVDDAGYNKFNLICPCCGSIYLHQSTINVYNRDEDADKGLHVIVENDMTITGTDMQNNPSPRREGLSIKFWCEECPEKLTLNIYQHKGETLIEWKPKE
jgi:hypothetical protein